MSRTSVVAKARQPFWVNGFPQPVVQITGKPFLVEIAAQEPPRQHEGSVFFGCSRTFSVIPPGKIETTHLISSESPRPDDGRAFGFRTSLLNPGDQVWFPASIACTERIFVHEGAALSIQNLPLNPSDIPNPPPTITYATILPYEPPRPEDGRYTWYTKPILNPDLVSNVTPTCIVSAEPAQPDRGVAAIFVRQVLALAQVTPGPPDYVSQEPPRPYEGAANIFARRPLISTQLIKGRQLMVSAEPPRPEHGSVAYVRASLESHQFAPVPPRFISSEPPRPESGNSYAWTHRELVVSQQASPPRWARVMAYAEPPPAYPGDMRAYACTTLSLRDLWPRVPIIAVAEPPLPESGRVFEASNQTGEPVPYATSISAYTEAPLPESGRSVAFENRPFIPSQLRSWPARITPFEPPLPEPGSYVFLTNRPLNASQLHVNPVIIVSAEPPRPESGRWYCFSNTTLSVQTYPNPWISPSKLKGK